MNLASHVWDNDFFFTYVVIIPIQHAKRALLAEVHKRVGSCQYPHRLFQRGASGDGCVKVCR